GAIAADRGGKFRPLPGEAIDFGFTKDRLWLKLAMRNGADAPRRSVLALNVNHMYRIDAWLVTARGVNHLMGLTEKTPFAARPTPDPHLAAPFTLAGAEPGVIYIAYWSSGATALPLTIETPESYAEQIAAKEALHAASYAILGVFIALSILLWATLR